MKKLMIIVCALLLGVSGAQLVHAQQIGKPAYNFGDHKSSTLAGKAWKALADKDLDGVLAYTNKCVEMYGAEAAKMQAGLLEVPKGEPSKIHSYWALNDVATSLYIQGEAYYQAGQKDKAKSVFERIIKEFSFGQTYDPASNSFWKPSDGAADKISMIDKGLNLDFGNMSSQVLVARMWDALGKKDLELAIAYSAKLVGLYGQTAKDMQKSMTEYAWESPEKIHSFWALNDVGTGMFILGEAYRAAGKNEEAVAAYKQVVNDYLYAQCWDPNGWFWKPAEAAQQKLIELDVQK